jgi:hypothetical protein
MKYSIDEIDRLRELVVLKLVKGTEYEKYPHPEDFTNLDSVERRLRTYMLNGTTVEELEEWLKNA